MNIEPVYNNILFQFSYETLHNRFVNNSRAGLLISSLDVQQTNIPRWAQVTHVGPEVIDVKIGDHILIDEGKWTPGFMIGGQRYWKTDEDQVMLISDRSHEVY